MQCEPSNPLQLWSDHAPRFISDIRHRYRGASSALIRLHSDSDTENYALLEVKNALELMGNASLSDFGLPLPTNLPPLPQEIQAADDHVQQLQEEVSSAHPLFNADQKSVFNEVVGTVLPGVMADDLNAAVSRAQSTIPKAFFLDAPAGTGKTFVTRAIHAFLLVRSKNVIAVATSAVAAALLDGGRTAHSSFKIPIPCDYGSICNVSASSNRHGNCVKQTLFFGIKP